MKTWHLTKGFIAIVAALFVMNSLALGQWTRSGNKVYTSSTAYHVGIGTGATMSQYKKLEVKHTYTAEPDAYGLYVDIKNIEDDAGHLYGAYIRSQSSAGNWYSDIFGIYSKAISAIDAEFGSIYGGYFEAALSTGSAYDNHSYGIYVKGIDLSGSYGIYVKSGHSNYFEKPVSIGTTDPGPYGCKLNVNGKIRAKEIVVETGWPDFVFEEDYDLRPLDEVEEYIKANKHLPDMPSDDEVAENGIGLGEMQARLLQKVEELTLYVIDLKKENEALKARVVELGSR